MFNKKINNKGMFPIVGVAAILGVVAILFLLFGGSDPVVGNNLASACKIEYEPSVTADSEFLIKRVGDTNEWNLILHENDLSGGNYTSLTVTPSFSRTDKCSENGVLTQSAIEYRFEGERFEDVVNANNDKYYAIQWVDSTNKYNVTIDGNDYATSKIVNEAVVFGTPATAPTVMNIAGTDVLELGALEEEDYVKLGTFEGVGGSALNPEVYGTINILYNK